MRSYYRWFLIVVVLVVPVEIGATANNEESETKAGIRFESSVSAVGNLFYQIE